MSVFRPLPELASALRARSVDAGDSARAAVATILRPSGASPEVLFIARAEREGDPWSGDVAFPGGKRDPGDESLTATAIRETREEVGLVLPPDSFVARLPDVVGRTNGYRVAQFVFVLDDAAAEAATPKTSAEVAALFWIPLATLVDPALLQRTTVERNGLRFDVPCIRLGERILWGMTLRMTQELATAMGTK